MKRVSFHTLGCKLNFAETSTLARRFADAGFVRVAADGGISSGDSMPGDDAEEDGGSDGATGDGTDRANGGGTDETTGGGVPRADVYVVNSCSVTAAADKKCRNLVARLHRRSPRATIVVTGCYAQLAPERVAAIPGVDIVLGNDAKDDVVSAVVARVGMSPVTDALAATDTLSAERFSATDTSPASGVPVAGAAARAPAAELFARGLAYAPRSGAGDGETASGSAEGGNKTGAVSTSEGCADGGERFFAAYSAGERTRSFLKVQDGCDYRCSYCTIPAARGRSRNIPIARVVEQAREIAARGVREIVLTGINTGDFGRTTGESFVDLLRALDAVDGIARYRVSSIEPNLLTDEAIEFCAASRAFQPHFHIPLQSGSDRVLGLMRRRYVSGLFEGRVARVREAMPDAFIGVDVIVGFPGETDGDFEATRALLERVCPAQLHVFPYSVRPGTPAAGMPGRVSPRVAAARAAELGALSDRLHAEFRARFAGTEAEVLWEGEGSGGKMSGFTSNYIKVSAPHDPALVGAITRIVL